MNYRDIASREDYNCGLDAAYRETAGEPSGGVQLDSGPGRPDGTTERLGSSERRAIASATVRQVQLPPVADSGRERASPSAATSGAASPPNGRLLNGRAEYATGGQKWE